jgi:hypothetical protein
MSDSPRLKELHLQVRGFDDFLTPSHESHLIGPLSKFAPASLATLVIDPATSVVPQDAINLLLSTWLNDDWPNLARSQMAVEYIVSGEYGSISGSLAAENMNRVIIIGGISCRCVRRRVMCRGVSGNGNN